MKTSSKGIALIKKYEGCKLVSYLCPAGVWTIGWGTTSADKNYTGMSVTKGMRITQKKADTLLKQSLPKYEKLVNKYHKKYKFTQTEYDAMISFAYNIGSLDQLTDNGNRSKEVIAEKMLLYFNADGKKLDGLVKRREEEHKMFTSGWKNKTITTNKTTKK